MNNPLDYENPLHRPPLERRYWLPERSFGTVSFVGVIVSIPAGLFIYSSSGVLLGLVALLFWGMPFAGVICAMIGLGADERMGWALLGLIANLFWLMFGWAAVLSFELRNFHLA